MSTVAESADKISFFYGNPTTAISDCLRGFMRAAPGNKFVSADFSNIEGRVLAWLAGEEWKLKAFADFDKGIGFDIYKLAYGKAYNVDPATVTDKQRQVGKVMELALGFGGGVGAFQQMAKGYNVVMPDKEADIIKKGWRFAHENIVIYWAELDNAAMQAVMKPGSIQIAGADYAQVKYRVAGSFLWCLLPSGRPLCYPYPKIERVTTPWGQVRDALTYMAENSLSRKFERCSTHGGVLAENNTQAVARDCMTEAMFRVEEYNYPIVLHCHDELVSEVDQNFGSLDEYEKIMGKLPEWAAGLPISAKGSTGKRYGK